MRFRPASFCTLALAALLAGAGLCQEESQDKSYYPLRVGNQWTYAAAGGQKRVLRVAREEKFDDVPCAVVESLANGKAMASEHLAAKKDGIYRLASNGMKVDPPVLLLRLPPRKGDRWKVDSKIAGRALQGTLAVAEEAVAVPAGKYQAVSVHSDDMKLGDKAVTVTQWFAPGVGPVKQVVDFDGKKMTLELEKFEAGK